MKITDDKNEIIALGRQMMAEKPEVYSRKSMDDLWEAVCSIYDRQTFEDGFYSAVYYSEVYGTYIEEPTLYGFEDKTHEEKMQYLTAYNSIEYLKFLNDAHDTHLLDNKYSTYRILKPFYKRDAMLLSEESDYEAFCAFTQKHKSIFVKPVNLSRGAGVHRLAVQENSDIRRIFDLLLQEAAELSPNYPGKRVIHKLILEEEIIPSDEIARFNPAEMSFLRVTTVLVDGNVHFLYPCFRIMCGDGVEKRGEVFCIDALIDADTGIVVTDGMRGSRDRFTHHPVTGIKIKGFAMPEWEQLKAMLNNAARLFRTVRYIGWDVTHSVNGWCIIEGNPNGEFFSQECVGHGIRDEFCRLIGYPEKKEP